MDISKIDPNFKIIDQQIDGKLIKVPSEKVALFGLHYDKEIGFYRMDEQLAKSISDNLGYLNMMTAGGRVAFKTNSTIIKIHVVYDSLDKMHHMPLTGQAGFSLNEVIRKKEIHKQTFAFDFSADKGYSSSSQKLDGSKMHPYILHFPLYNKVKGLVIEIDKGSRIKPFNPYKDVKPFIYYGSSITQGGCASRADTSYQDFIQRWTNIDYINLGYSGNAKGEREVAEYIAKQPCSLFVMDYDHNAPDKEHLAKTHEAFFKIFRKANPTTPVIILSAPTYYEDIDAYEPRRQIIEQTYKHSLEQGDNNVYFVDGRNLFPKEEREFATVDGCHPTDLGFYFMAKAIYKEIKRIKF